MFGVHLFVFVVAFRGQFISPPKDNNNKRKRFKSEIEQPTIKRQQPNSPNNLFCCYDTKTQKHKSLIKKNRNVSQDEGDGKDIAKKIWC